LNSAPPDLTLPERRGLVLVLSSPSGAGKTTLARRLLESDPSIRMSVSVTTRPPRPGEVDGVDYWFIDEEEFCRRRDAGELLEWAHVFGKYYGSPRKAVDDMLAAGCDVLFDIDWQGAQQLAEHAAQDLVRVFVLPPSGPILEQRLKARAQDSELVVAQRMARAAEEISHWGEYDYVIVNADLNASTEALRAILLAERHRRDRLVGLPDFVRRMQDSL
jgi:guanylate kinase